MAFSFSPGQIAPEGSQALAPPGTVTPGTAIAPTSGPPSDSPFLFIKEKGQPLSIMACVQIVLIVVSVLSVIICATMYSYSVYLTAQIKDKRTELDLKDSTIPTYPYDEMNRLTKRMATLDKLLQNYISPRSPLKFLENVVEDQVVFDTFALTKDLTGAYKINFIAVTDNYTALIQQLEALNLKEYSRVVPNPKAAGLNEAGQIIRINVISPVLVAGKLPDDVIFLKDPATSTPIEPTPSPSKTSP